MRQPVPTRYIPTVASFAPPHKLIVAGKLGSRIAVEAWTLKPPQLATLASGEQILIPQGLAAIRLVYESDDPDLGMVKLLVTNRGKANHSFLTFSGVHGLYELDWGEQATQPLALVLSVTDQPLLATKEYVLFNGGHHQAQGYVYWLSTWDRDHLFPALALFDTGLDGAIDVHRKITPEEWRSEELDRNWIEYLGAPPPW